MNYAASRLFQLGFGRCLSGRTIALDSGFSKTSTLTNHRIKIGLITAFAFGSIDMVQIGKLNSQKLEGK